MPRLTAVVPVSDEDPMALPVKALGPAIAFYQSILGFSVLRRDTSAAQLARDEVRIGLVVRQDHDAARAGSLAMEVDDLEALHRELQRAGGEPGEFRVDDWQNRSHRTFFVREHENGYCYCFFTALEPGAT